MTYYLPLQDGRYMSFDDDVPEREAYVRVWRFNNPEPPPPPKDKPYFLPALSSGVDTLQGGLYSAVEGGARSLGLGSLADWAKEGAERNQREADEALPHTQRQTWQDARTVTDYVKFATQALGTSLPSMVPAAAAALATTALTGGAAPAAAVVAGLAAGVPGFYGTHREEQKKTRPGEEVEEGRAFLAAIPAAALDAVGNIFTLGLGKPGAMAAREAGAGLLARVAKGMGVGAASEMPTEVAQQVLERWQARKDLLSPDAIAEYKEVAAAAAAVGGMQGGAHRGLLGKRKEATGARGEDHELNAALRDFHGRPAPTETTETTNPTLALEGPPAPLLLKGPPETTEAATNPRSEDTDLPPIPLPDGRVRMGNLAEEALLPEAEPAPDPHARAAAEQERLLAEQASADTRAGDARVAAAARGDYAAMTAEPASEPASLAQGSRRPRASDPVVAESPYTTPSVEEAVPAPEGASLAQGLRRPRVSDPVGVESPYAPPAAPPVTTAPSVTTAPVATDPTAPSVTTAPVTTAPVTTNPTAPPVTTAPVTTNPTAPPNTVTVPLWLLRAPGTSKPTAPVTVSVGDLLANMNRHPQYQRSLHDLAARFPGLSDAELARKMADTVNARAAAPPGTAKASGLIAPEPATAAGAVADPGLAAAKAAAAAAKAAAAAARATAARTVIADRLNKLRGRGAQGKLVAAGAMAALNDRSLSPGQLYAAFRAADVMAAQLPAGANHRVEFVSRILATELSAEARAASGVSGRSTVAALRRSPTAAAQGLIQLSLAPDAIDYIHQNAAHEAHHVLTDYYARYDPALERRLAADFRGDADGKMSLADVERTLRRKLETTRAPGGEKSYWGQLEGAFGTARLSTDEMRAVVFGSLSDAARRGAPMSGLRPAYTRLVLALRQFFQRLGSALRGDGFANAADLLGRAADGDGHRFDTRASPVGSGETQASGFAYSPELQATLAKIDGPKAPPPPAAGGRGAWSAVALRLRKMASGAHDATRIYGPEARPEGFVDAMVRTAANLAHPFYVLEKTQRALKISLGLDAGRALEQAGMSDAHVSHFMHDGLLRYNKESRSFEAIPGTGKLALIKIFEGRVAEADIPAFGQYAVLKREKAHRSQGEPLFFAFEDAEIESGLRELDAVHPGFAAVADDLQKFNDALVELLVETGTIHRTMADRLKSMFYTPFYRQMDADAYAEPGQVFGDKTRNAIFGKDAFASAAEGSDRAVEPFLASVVKNARGILRAASKNVAYQTATDTMLVSGLAERVAKPAPGQNDRVMGFYRDGEEVRYRVDDSVLWASLASMPPQARTGILKAAAAFADFYRASVTMTPSFLAANLWRGKTASVVQEGGPAFGNTIRAIRDAYLNAPSAQAFRVSTGFGANIYGQSDAALGDAAARGLRTKDGTHSWMDRLKNFGDHLNRLSGATELAERLVLRDHLMAKGMSEKDASWQAYQLAPFARHGTGDAGIGRMLGALIPYVPFLSAKIQGVNRLAEIARAPGGGWAKTAGPAATRAVGALVLRGLVLSVFSTLAAMWSANEDPERWAGESTESKVNNDILYWGEHTLRLPRAFEVGFVFGAVPVLAFDAALKGSGRDVAHGLGSGLVSSFQFTPLPALAVPVLAVATNFDFFRHTPLTSPGKQALPVAERTASTTSDIAKWIASTPGADKIGLSPINAQTLMDGYLGPVGAIAVEFVGGLLGAAGATPAKPEGAFGDPAGPLAIAGKLAGVNRFVKFDPTERKSVSDFYEMAEELKQTVRSIETARRTGRLDDARRATADHAPLLRLKTGIHHAEQQLTALRHRIEYIEQHPAWASAQKSRMLEPLWAASNLIARRTVETARRIGAA